MYGFAADKKTVKLHPRIIDVSGIAFYFAITQRACMTDSALTDELNVAFYCDCSRCAQYRAVQLAIVA